MADIIKNENFTADVLLNLLSETTDDYLYMWDIRNGTFYISDNAQAGPSAVHDWPDFQYWKTE